MTLERTYHKLVSVVGCSILASVIYTPQAEAQSAKTIDAHYDYLYADVTSGRFDAEDGQDGNATSLAIGVSRVFNQDWLFVTDYSARFLHPDDVTVQRYTLMPGVGYRYSLSDSWDISSRVKAGMIWSQVKLDGTDEKINKDSEFIYGADVAVRFFATEKLSFLASAELNRSDIVDENIYIARADYRVSQRFTFGAFYSYRSDETLYVNEGGLSLKFAF